MVLSQAKDFGREEATSNLMDLYVSHQLLHVARMGEAQNMMNTIGNPPGSSYVEFTDALQTAATLHVRNEHGAYIPVGAAGGGAVTDPLTLNRLNVTTISLGGVPITSWPTAGSNQGVSTWADLTDTPRDYGSVDQIIVSKGRKQGSDQDDSRFRYTSVQSLLPAAVTFATSVSTPELILNGVPMTEWPAAGVNAFTALRDVGIPSLTGRGGQYLTINPAGTQIVSIATSFLSNIGGVSTFASPAAVGQVLTATSANAASWQTPSGGTELSGVTSVSGTAQVGSILSATSGTAASWTNTPTFSGLATFSAGINLGGVTRTAWPGAATAVAFGATLPSSPTTGDIFALTAEAGSSGRGLQESKSRTIQATTNEMTIDVQDQSYGSAGLEYYGYAVHESRSAPGVPLGPFGTQPPGFSKVKAVMWSPNNTGGEIYVQMDADVTDQGTIVMRAFGNDYNLPDDTTRWTPPAVSGTAQKAYFASHLNLPAGASNTQRETISFWRTGNVGIGIPIGTAAVTQAYWEDYAGGRPVVSGVTLPDVDGGFSLGDQFALTRAHGSEGRGLKTLREASVTTSIASMGATLTKGTDSADTTLYGFSGGDNAYTAGAFGGLSPDDEEVVGALLANTSNTWLLLLDTHPSASETSLELDFAGTKRTLARQSFTDSQDGKTYRVFQFNGNNSQIVNLADGSTILVTFPFAIGTSTTTTTGRTWQPTLGGNPVVAGVVLPDPADFAVGDTFIASEAGWHGGRVFQLEDVGARVNRFLFTAGLDPTSGQNERGYSQIPGIGDYGRLDDDGAADEVERAIGAFAVLPNPTLGYADLYVADVALDGIQTAASLVANIKNVTNGRSGSYSFSKRPTSDETGYLQFRNTNLAQVSNIDTEFAVGDVIQVDLFTGNDQTNPWAFRSPKRWRPVETPAHIARGLEGLRDVDKMTQQALTGYRARIVSSRPATVHQGEFIIDLSNRNLYFGQPPATQTNRNQFTAHMVSGRADLGSTSGSHIDGNYEQFVDAVYVVEAASGNTRTLTFQLELDIPDSSQVTSEPANIYVRTTGFPANFSFPAVIALTRSPGYQNSLLNHRVVRYAAAPVTVTTAAAQAALNFTDDVTITLWSNAAGTTALNFKPVSHDGGTWVQINN